MAGVPGSPNAKDVCYSYLTDVQPEGFSYTSLELAAFDRGPLPELFGSGH